MERKRGLLYFLILVGTFVILTISGSIYFQRILRENPQLYDAVRMPLYLAGLLVIGITSLIFTIMQIRIFRPLNQLEQNLKKQSGLKENRLDSLPIPNDIGPLLHAIEIILRSYNHQVQETEAKNESLRSVLNQITDGIVMVDNQGLVSSMNPAAERIFSISSDQARGRTVAEVLRQHQWIELYKHCRDLNQESSATLELAAQKIFLQGIAIPPGESLPGHTLMVFQDLSEIHRLETTRQDFISNISHELRTPLASLKALTDTLQEGALDDPSAARSFLARMDTEVDSLAQMVSELLELSRIESGMVPLNLKPTSPEAVIKSAQERMGAQAQRKNIQIENQIEADLPNVLADARRVIQVLVNLIHNAIKFSAPNSTINLAARQDAASIIFSVEDFGTGIPESVLNRIFERFYKTDQSRASGGTGLGLSIAKHIIEAHQGRIWAESTYGQGSCFFFSIPLEKRYHQ